MEGLQIDLQNRFRKKGTRRDLRGVGGGKGQGGRDEGPDSSGGRSLSILPLVVVGNGV